MSELEPDYLISRISRHEMLLRVQAPPIIESQRLFTAYGFHYDVGRAATANVMSLYTTKLREADEYEAPIVDESLRTRLHTVNFLYQELFDIDSGDRLENRAVKEFDLSQAVWLERTQDRLVNLKRLISQGFESWSALQWARRQVRLTYGEEIGRNTDIMERRPVIGYLSASFANQTGTALPEPETVTEAQFSRQLRRYGLVNLSNKKTQERYRNIEGLLCLDGLVISMASFVDVVTLPRETGHEAFYRDFIDKMASNKIQDHHMHMEAIQLICEDLSATVEDEVEGNYWETSAKLLGTRIRQGGELMDLMRIIMDERRVAIPEPYRLSRPQEASTEETSGARFMETYVELEQQMQDIETATLQHNQRWAERPKRLKENYRQLWGALCKNELKLAPPDEQTKAWASEMLGVLVRLRALTKDKPADEAWRDVQQWRMECDTLQERKRSVAGRTLRYADLARKRLPPVLPLNTHLDNYVRGYTKWKGLISEYWPGDGARVAEDLYQLLGSRQPDRAIKTTQETPEVSKGERAQRTLRERALPGRSRNMSREEEEFLNTFSVTEMMQEPAPRERGPSAREPEAQPETHEVARPDMGRLMALGDFCNEMGGQLYRLEYGWEGKGPAAYIATVRLPDQHTVGNRLYAVVEVPFIDFATYIIADEEWLAVVEQLNRTDSAVWYDAVRKLHTPGTDPQEHIAKVRQKIQEMHQRYAAGGHFLG